VKYPEFQEIGAGTCWTGGAIQPCSNDPIDRFEMGQLLRTAALALRLSIRGKGSKECDSSWIFLETMLDSLKDE